MNMILKQLNDETILYLRHGYVSSTMYNNLYSFKNAVAISTILEAVNNKKKSFFIA